MEGRERQVDADQLAALRRLRVAFGHVEVLAVRADGQPDAHGPAGVQGMLEEAEGRR